MSEPLIKLLSEPLIYLIYLIYLIICSIIIANHVISLIKGSDNNPDSDEQ
jgi:hypothetical protein